MITMHALGMILGLGFLLGMRHATEADHVVAVATLVSEGRSLPAAALTGACWGGGTHPDPHRRPPSPAPAPMGRPPAAWC